LLVAMSLAACLFVGVTSRVLKDEDREWLSRRRRMGVAAGCVLDGSLRRGADSALVGADAARLGKIGARGGGCGRGLDQRPDRFEFPDQVGQGEHGKRQRPSAIHAHVPRHDVGGSGLRRGIPGRFGDSDELDSDGVGAGRALGME